MSDYDLKLISLSLQYSTGIPATPILVFTVTAMTWFVTTSVSATQIMPAGTAQVSSYEPTVGG